MIAHLFARTVRASSRHLLDRRPDRPFFSNQMIFQPQAAGYRDDDGIVKLISSNGAKISARYLVNPKATFTILFSHGNAEDIGDDERLFHPLLQAGLASRISDGALRRFPTLLTLDSGIVALVSPLDASACELHRQKLKAIQPIQASCQPNMAVHSGVPHSNWFP
jgi:hypothetical protein